MSTRWEPVTRNLLILATVVLGILVFELSVKADARNVDQGINLSHKPLPVTLMVPTGKSCVVLTSSPPIEECSWQECPLYGSDGGYPCRNVTERRYPPTSCRTKVVRTECTTTIEGKPDCKTYEREE